MNLGRLIWKPSGSASSPSCSPPTSCSTASISAPASPTSWSRAPTPNAASCSRSIGPVWDGNEVWLLAAGGTLYFAFPALYASSFSGFYLPLMIVLWLLILRGISIEFRNHIDSIVWHPLWDAVFAGSSALLAIFFGAALGNVVRGVPLDSAGEFFLPLWTDFAAGPERRNSRLVHDSRRRCRPAHAHRPRRALAGAQERRRARNARPLPRLPRLVGRARQPSSRSLWPASVFNPTSRKASPPARGLTSFRSSLSWAWSGSS